LLTCISPPLLLADRAKRGVLEPSDFRLEKPQVHEGRTAVVVPRGLLGSGAADREDRDPPPVRAAHLDALKLAPTDEPEGPEEEVVGLKHWTLPVDCGRRGGLASVRIEVGPSLL
jgi:hypothetical protein